MVIFKSLISLVFLTLALASFASDSIDSTHLQIYEQAKRIDSIPFYKSLDQLCKKCVGSEYLTVPLNLDNQNDEHSRGLPDDYKVEVSLLSQIEVDKAFTALSSLSYIPFSYPDSGCYARAHEMGLLLDQRGIISAKIFLFGDLKVKTKNHPKGEVNWLYHVAPIVRQKISESESVVMVLDPSLFNRAVTINEWQKIQTLHAPTQSLRVVYTKRFTFKPDELMDLDYTTEWDEYDLTDKEYYLLKYFSEYLKRNQ